MNNVQNTPLFKDKNEVQSSGYIGFNHIEQQFAYSIAEKIGIVFNSFLSPDGDDISIFGEIGAGYLDEIGKYKFELYGGYGIGRININYVDISFMSDPDYWDVYSGSSKYDRIFIQPIIGRNVNEKFSYGISLRTNLINYKNYKYIHYRDSYSNYSEERDTFETINLRDVIGFIADPIAFVRVGPKYWKFNFQLGYSISYFPTSRHITYDYHYPYYSNYQSSSFPLYQKLIINGGIIVFLGHYKDEK